MTYSLTIKIQDFKITSLKNIQARLKLKFCTTEFFILINSIKVKIFEYVLLYDKQRYK